MINAHGKHWKTSMTKAQINAKIKDYEMMLGYLKESRLQGQDYDNEYHRLMSAMSDYENMLMDGDYE